MKILYRILAFTFLLLVLGTSLRFVIFRTYIQSQKSTFRATVLKQSSSEIQEIDIITSELQNPSGKYEWKENKKELMIAGVLYEVIKISIIGNRTHVTLMEDKAENQLFSTFFKLNSNKHPALTDMVKVLLSLIFIASLPLLITPLFHILRNPTNRYLQKIIPKPVFEIVIPPKASNGI